MGAAILGADRVILLVAMGLPGFTVTRAIPGGSDQTSVINADIASIPSPSGILLFPPGNYGHSSQLIVPNSGITLMGCGQGVTTLTYGAATGDAILISAGGAAESGSGNTQIANTVIRDMTLTTSVNRTAGAAINLVHGYPATFDNIGILYNGSANQFTGLSFQGGGGRIRVNNCQIIGCNTNNLTKSGATVSGLASGSGVQMFGLASSVGGGAYAINDVFIGGSNNLIQGFASNISIEGNSGGVVISGSEARTGNYGLLCNTAGGPLGRGTNPNREIFLSTAAFFDDNFLVGAFFDTNSFNILNIVNIWIAGQGQWIDGTYPADFGFDAGYAGMTVNAQNGTTALGRVNITGGNFRSNGGAGLQIGGVNIDASVVGCFASENGQAAGKGAPGLYLGNFGSVTLGSNYLVGNIAGTASFSGYGLATAGTYTALTLAGNTTRGNGTGTTSLNATGGTTINPVTANNWL